jgi:fructose-bisphosphate aldolase, class I
MTRITTQVKKILECYEGLNPGVLTNLCRVLMHGKLGGTGRMVMLPVDQGFEHGPDKSFISNNLAYDPEYHISLAIEAGLSAYAAPLGMLEAVAGKYAGGIPLILKMNSANKLEHLSREPDQAITSSVKDALRLGCSGVGLTLYPGSDNANDMIEVASEISEEAKAVGLFTMIWAYPRGAGITKEDEDAIDVVGYAVHIAALIGAHIIKSKIPSHMVYSKEVKSKYKEYGVDISTAESRIKHIKQNAFNGKRIVLFSGGATKDVDELYGEMEDIKNGGGNGSIIGRNVFQRERSEALTMLDKILKIYH